MNIACKAVLGEITNIKYAADKAVAFDPPDGPTPVSFMDAIDRDPIAIVRTLVGVVSN